MVRMTCAIAPVAPRRRCWKNIKNNFDAVLLWTPETKAERIKIGRDIQLALKQEKDRTNETAMRPLRKSDNRQIPEYIDRRLRNYRSRYGAYQYDWGIYNERLGIQSRHSSGRNDYSRQRVKPMPSRERNCLREILFPSVNQNKYLNAMWRKGGKQWVYILLINVDVGNKYHPGGIRITHGFAYLISMVWMRWLTLVITGRYRNSYPAKAKKMATLIENWLHLMVGATGMIEIGMKNEGLYSRFT